MSEMLPNKEISGPNGGDAAIVRRDRTGVTGRGNAYLRLRKVAFAVSVALFLDRVCSPSGLCKCHIAIRITDQVFLKIQCLQQHPVEVAMPVPQCLLP
jgi:hypothetical protein